MNIAAWWRTRRAKRSNDKTGQVTSGRMDQSERSAEFRRKKYRLPT